MCLVHVANKNASRDSWSNRIRVDPQIQKNWQFWCISARRFSPSDIVSNVCISFKLPENDEILCAYISWVIYTYVYAIVSPMYFISSNVNKSVTNILYWRIYNSSFLWIVYAALYFSRDLKDFIILYTSPSCTSTYLCNNRLF